MGREGEEEKSYLDVMVGMLGGIFIDYIFI